MLSLVTVSALTVVVLALWSRTLCHECLSRPPTHPAGGELWSCCGSGRFGDTTQGGAWQVQKHPLSGSLFFSALVCFCFFAALRWGGEGGRGRREGGEGKRGFWFRPWRGGVTPRANKFVGRHLGRSL